MLIYRENPSFRDVDDFFTGALLSTAVRLSTVVHKDSHRISLFKQDTFNLVDYPRYLDIILDGLIYFFGGIDDR